MSVQPSALPLIAVIAGSLLLLQLLVPLANGDNNSNNAAVFQFPEYDYKETSKNVGISICPHARRTL